MKRVFAYDVLRCHHDGNRRQVIARITEACVIRRIFVYLGLPKGPPPLAPPRLPPELVFDG